MSARFFGFFAVACSLLLGIVELLPSKDADRSVEHYLGLMALISVGIWSVLRKLEGKQPL